MKSWLHFSLPLSLCHPFSALLRIKETHDSIQDQKYFGYYTGISFFCLFNGDLVDILTPQDLCIDNN